MNEIDDWIRDLPEIKTCSIAGVLEGIKSLPIQFSGPKTTDKQLRLTTVAKTALCQR